MSSCGHTYCQNGWFHSAEPLHTHTHCKNCFRMRRCEGDNKKLLRCKRCSMASYCSKDCQKAHWRAGHKAQCDFYALSAERAAAISGNPTAWSDLATFVEYHHPTLVNSALACYLRTKANTPDVTSQYILELSILYRNDPSLPPHKRFEPRGMDFVHKDGPACIPIYPVVFASRPGAVDIGKQEFGRDYWGTGAYLLMIKFHEGEFVGSIPFWKHFGIDKLRGNATLACKHPWDQIRESVAEGRKPRFCCGKIEGLPTCCCGGWTHQSTSQELVPASK